MIANQYGLNVETVAGVVSALSPNNKWDINIIDAENLIRAYLFEIEYPKVCTFGTQRDKAIMMLENNYDNPKTCIPYGFVRYNVVVSFNVHTFSAFWL